MIVKVCGITRVEDAKLALKLGAWGIGFIFHPKSPRYILPEAARKIASALPSEFHKVGVFVNTPVADMQAIAAEVGLTVFQLHGDETPETVSQLPGKVLKALHLKKETDLALLERYKGAWGLLLDAGRGELRGGTGELADWTLAKRAVLQVERAFLAGGLGPANVESAIADVGPYGLDLSSGLEASPGVKDPAKMEEFFRKVKKNG